MDYPILAPSQVSEHLRALRKARGLSQADLGRLLGLSQSRIARIERAPTQVSVDALLQVLAALGARMVFHTGPAPAAASGVVRPRTARKDPAAGDW